MNETSCEVCGYNLVLDNHHWSKTEISYLCPNCHSIYERIIRKRIEKNCKKMERNRIVVYKNYKKRYAIPKIRKYLDNGEPRKTYVWEGGNANGWSWGKTIIGCKICNFDKVIDSHHFGNKDCDKGKFFGRPSSHRSNREYIYLCPNHHAILHRILKDRDGTKFNSKLEIIKNINKVINNVHI